MISFIVIGRNEGRNLLNCFNSIKTLSKKIQVPKEVIYVDSNSEDDSVNIANSFKDVKVIVIEKGYNQAIARNIGAKNSVGEVLFFVDGDMELSEEFFFAVFNEKNEVKYNYTSGQLLNRFFDEFQNKCGEGLAFPGLKQIRKEYTTGGVFLINRDCWELVNGMKPKYKVNEDLDLGFRLAKKGIFLTRLPQLIAIHNTMDISKRFDYFNVFKNKKLLFKGVLMRDHFFNRYAYRRLLRMDFNFYFLIFSIVFSIAIHPVFLSLYVFIIFFRSAYGLLKKKSFFYLLTIYFLRDFAALLGFFFFFPSANKHELKK